MDVISREVPELGGFGVPTSETAQNVGTKNHISIKKLSKISSAHGRFR